MAISYTQVTVSGYNSSAPPDDGSTGASNQVTWASIKTKLSDPLKTALESIDDNVATAIALAESDVNSVETAYAAADTANLATLRGELNAPSSTAAIFVQTAAPTGWTKVTTHNNKALRLVSGTVSTGGSTAFTSVFTSRTIAQANLPNVNLTSTTTAVVSYDTVNLEDTAGSVNPIQSPVTSTITVPLGGSGTAMDFAVQYVDCIYATKD